MQTSPTDAREAERGLTLLEVLVVLSLLGFALVAIGNVTGATARRTALETAVQQTADTLQAARTRAIGSGLPVAVEIDAEAGRIGWPAHEVRVGTSVRLEAVLAREAAHDGMGRIVFFPDGTSTGGSLTLRTADARHTVAVHWLTGAVDAQ
ncbi:GspH/FimT family pseudopilin [Futiania mangrovi]|uniref:Type II secretion system protein H n=1 Tax=Futiania mangrovi TaxID=2959716 RepID=A0A9J6PMH4_9PROT|nr:GspH/FimT family pseudopilin [Futiania mangrovii]MCP1337879.1 GspH/FimT family pseudopilin [Futiania mangrovii]